MAHFEPRAILDETNIGTATTSGTEVIPLAKTGVISQINLEAAVAVTGSTNPGLNLWDIITKVEVLGDGSRIIKSLDARQIRALAYYHDVDISSLGWYHRHDTSGEKTWWTYPIMFGRYPMDTKYMLNLDSYKDPTLRITWDASQTTLWGDTYYPTTSPYMRFSVSDICYKGGSPEANAFIQSMEVEQWTCAASARHTTEIPRGYPLVGILSGARYNDDKQLDYQDKVELDFDNGEWKPLQHGYHELYMLNGMWFPKPVHIVMRKDMINAKPLDLAVGMCNQFQAWMSNEIVSNVYLAHEGTWTIQDLVMYTTGAAAYTTYVSCDFSIFGRMAHQYMYFPMNFFAENKADAVPTDGYKRIDLHTTTAAGANTAAKLKTVCEYIVPNGQ